LEKIGRSFYSKSGKISMPIDSLVAEGQLIAEHNRHFGRDQLICGKRSFMDVLEFGVSRL
jgi:hypothetical protein